ncbi:fumarylacetoacetate hydrolase family protein [Halopelagius longus]|uniref:2-keto-4-pentenoate hydratase/2-oxohepta-3-ene-1,7-dioic acid hydratase (Catechol pathway) n=1 Tax=Halopelagius longus TaxID=1236180 RepID=A0A1H1FZU4_9EURY|nr:fumarylacetoacetate hydrolase family protein [Halopelagius longus]RDI69930.1 fumarylacetoacetate hydrolase family protein [Halopelagius longus]SDR06451.1 2-keto-4-pentenoate hydratase/2-oxohepta-3-ene-1,7-dioic acid hydratase (catechol pathway) [Halopelagius longus]
MKLATFEVETDVGRFRRVGVVDEASLLDVTAGYSYVLDAEGTPKPTERARSIVPPDALELLRVGDDAIDAARTVLDADIPRGDDVRAPDGARVRYDEDEVRLLSPLPRPNSIRDFSVFEGHADHVEKPDVWYDIPVYYKGNPDSVVRPGADVPWPAWENKLDFELEVAAIIGSPGENIDAEDAMDHVAGFTIFNDFTARDTQFREMEMPLGPAKGKDFANGFGPYLVTSDAFEADGAAVRARVNGDRWMSGSLSEMYHSWGEMIEYASRDETLHPGDILGCGTVPGGCCLDLDRWIEPGDTIELEVDGIGTLSHTVTPSGDE